MAYPGRPRGPFPPHGPQQPIIRPSQMGNDFGAFPRFPRPEDPDIPVPEIRPTSPDPYARGGAFYRPSSTTVSDTDSDREKECENLRIQLEAMKNEVKKREELLAEERRLRLQQEQQLRARNQQDARTPEQAETREFVRQWTQGHPPPRQTGPAPAHNQTQSTTTGLINDFNKINIDPIATVLAQLGVKAQAQANIKLPERMHLKPAEEQHIKTITDMSADKTQELQRQAGLIAVLKHIDTALNLNLDPYIGFFTEQAAHSAENIIGTNAQISKVHTLADKFRVKVPKPVIIPEPPGFFRDRFAIDPLKVEKRLPPFDPDKEPNRCFAHLMKDLIYITKDEYFQERHWDAMLQNMLRGEAREEYSNCKQNNYTLDQTIEYLGSLYTRSKTIEDDKKELETFTRKQNEDLPRVMSRYRSKVQKLESLYDTHAFPAIMEAKLLSGLHAMITPKTKAYLETESVKATMAGAPFALDTLIQLAHTYEKNYNEVPTMNLTCGTNSVELQRKITQQSSLIADLKKENARAQEVNKKLDTLVQVASANFKRDKSKEKRPTSDKPAYRSSSKDKYSGSTKDVVMTDLSQQPQVSYGDNKLRADQSDEERIRKAKQQLRDEYNKYRQNSSMKQNNNNNRGRAATPGPKPPSRSGSNSSQKSGNGYSRSNSANGEKEAGATRVSVDITHRSNFFQCQVCSIDHPPYPDWCPAQGNV
jgi:hypothetical protein